MGERGKRVDNSRFLPATGIILAGGKSTRMGRNKAFLQIEGQSLLERSLISLQAIFGQVLISANDQALYGGYGVEVVGDSVLDQGPLAGIQAALCKAAYDVCFFTACDIPLIDEKEIRYLYSLISGYDIVATRSQKGIHPLFAFYHKNCLNIIERNLAVEKRRIVDIYPDCRVRYVEMAELAEQGLAGHSFINVNTPEEWEQYLKQQGLERN